MRALSLDQPWASLMLHPVEAFRKENETPGRRWPSLVGQELAIHATATLKRYARRVVELDYLSHDRFFDRAFEAAGWTLDSLPLGAVIGIVKVLDCRETGLGIFVPRLERAFGNYSEGRFFYPTEVVTRFELPISASGHQGIWNWEWPSPEALEILRHALGASHPGTKLGWRNYFLASLSDRDPDGRLCRQLVNTGHMHPGRLMNDGSERYYICTESGVIAATEGIR